MFSIICVDRSYICGPFFVLYRYGEPLYVLLYAFAVAVALGLVSILAGLLSNKECSDPVKAEQNFHLARAR